TSSSGNNLAMRARIVCSMASSAKAVPDARSSTALSSLDNDMLHLMRTCAHCMVGPPSAPTPAGTTPSPGCSPPLRTVDVQATILPPRDRDVSVPRGFLGLQCRHHPLGATARRPA